MKVKYLSNLRPQEQGVVATFTDDNIGSKLLAMGMRPGTKVQLMRKAPFRGGFYVKSGKNLLALRSSEANCIVLG